jgi:hypothetical protein
MEMSFAAMTVAVPLFLIAVALYHVSTNIGRLAKAVEGKHTADKPKLQG